MLYKHKISNCKTASHRDFHQTVYKAATFQSLLPTHHVIHFTSFDQRHSFGMLILTFPPQIPLWNPTLTPRGQAKTAFTDISLYNHRRHHLYSATRRSFPSTTFASRKPFHLSPVE